MNREPTKVLGTLLDAVINLEEKDPAWGAEGREPDQAITGGLRRRGRWG